MANVARVNGFRPVRYLSGAPWNGKARPYVIPASNGTATFVHDFVKLAGLADDVTGLPTVIQAAAGDANIGAIVGIEVSTPTFDSGTTHGNVILDTPLLRAASTRRIVYVADDPDILFEAQEDGVTTPLVAADVGQNINFIVGAGSTTTGASGMQIDSDTKATTATLPLKIMEVIRRPDNELVSGGQANTRWLVMINNHQFKGGTGTAGV